MKFSLVARNERVEEEGEEDDRHCDKDHVDQGSNVRSEHSKPQQGNEYCHHSVYCE